MRFAVTSIVLTVGLMMGVDALRNAGAAEMRRMRQPTVPPGWAQQFAADAEPAAPAAPVVAAVPLH